ncbi:MAG: hypothetical protein IJV12_02655, partial [Acidaminococcaceae bacterium]|nr:hypothetical protein [Acidaminococcaceae bacterium]
MKKRAEQNPPALLCFIQPCRASPQGEKRMASSLLLRYNSTQSMYCQDVQRSFAQNLIAKIKLFLHVCTYAATFQKCILLLLCSIRTHFF